MFAVCQLVGLMGLSISIPTHRFALISKLEIEKLSWVDIHTCRYDDYVPSVKPRMSEPSHQTPGTPQDDQIPSTWELTCTDILARMTGLVELKISTETQHPAAYTSDEINREILQPLRRLQLPNNELFEVKIFWNQYLEDPPPTLLTQQEAEEHGWAIPYCNPFTLIKMV